MSYLFLENEPLALFSFNEGIRIHIKRQHETETWKFCCNRCDSKFVNAIGLEMHLKSFHGVSNPSKTCKIRRLKNGNYILIDKI